LSVCHAQAADVLADPTLFESAIVTVTVNGTPRGDFFVQRAASGSLWVRRQDLPALGLQITALPSAQVDGIEHIALNRVNGLALALDEPTQTLVITAPPTLLARTVIAAHPTTRSVPRVTGEGAFLNWAIEQSHVTGATRPPASLTLEAGARLGPTLLLSRGQTVSDGTHSRFVRLMTAVTRDMPEQQARWTLGDLITGSDELSPGVVLGGLSYATLARLNPYQIRYPLGAVQGQALLPSEVEVYVDGQRVRTERVPAGVFEIRDLRTPLGARSVQLLVRDPYGRVQRFDQSVYASPRLLAPGVHDFQYAVGAVRRRLGQESADYGAPVVSARHAWGVTPTLTLGLRAEAREGFASAGGSVVWQVASRGLITAALAGSHAAQTRGQTGLLRYEYQSADWGLGLTHRADSAGYATLGESLIQSSRLRETQLQVSRRVGEGRSIWLSHSRLATRAASHTDPDWPFATLAPGRSTSVGFATFLRPWGGSLRIAATRVDDNRGPPRTLLTASLVFLLDGRNLLATQLRRDADSSAASVQWTRPPPISEGWGFDIGATQARGATDTTSWRTAAQRESRWARLRADLSGDTRNDQNALRVSAAGAFTFIAGQAYLSRPVEDSYALVQVGELPDIPVTVNGMSMGLTNRHGQLFVPRISAHYDTVVAIDTQALPLDHAVSEVQRRVVLPERSGTVIRFEARRLRALAAQLVWGEQPLARARVWIGSAHQAIETFTGPQGELYLENLAPGAHHGEVESERGRCRFDLHMPHHDEVLVELGTLACLPSPADQKRSEGPR
jgi:outer membrane usher protein FimD/PapC